MGYCTNVFANVNPTRCDCVPLLLMRFRPLGVHCSGLFIWPLMLMLMLMLMLLMLMLMLMLMLTLTLMLTLMLLLLLMLTFAQRLHNGRISSSCVRVHLPLRVLIVLARVGFTPHYEPGLPSTEGNTGFIVRGKSHSKKGGGGRRPRREAGKGAGSRSVEPASRIERFVCTSGQAQINSGSNTHNHL